MDKRRAWELAFALPLPVGLAFDMWGELTQQTRLGISELSQPLLITGLIGAFSARNITLFRSQEQIKALLTTELDARTHALEAAHRRERELIREQAHEAERQRIMRDMHDGLGSQLMSLLLASKKGAMAPQRMSEGIQAVIDEMRLIIESMDSVGGSLKSALVLFRQRAEAQAQEFGLVFTWRDELSTALPRYAPREVLQVFRILQEAVTNSLKHAGATALELAVEPGPQSSHPVRIVVRDNGSGLLAERGEGRGLSNMARRADGIGARLDIRSSTDGVAIVLDLPAREEAQL
jgi:signal transduction histidine kinase